MQYLSSSFPKESAYNVLLFQVERVLYDAKALCQLQLDGVDISPQEYMFSSRNACAIATHDLGELYGAAYTLSTLLDVIPSWSTFVLGEQVPLPRSADPEATLASLFANKGPTSSKRKAGSSLASAQNQVKVAKKKAKKTAA